MARIRSGWLVAVVALSLGLGAACKKSDDKKGDQATTADKMSEKMPAMPGGDKAASDDLSLLPVDSEVVVGINFAQLQQSALWKQFAPKLMDKAAKGLADFKAACGFDPLEAFKSMSIGIKGVGGTPDGAIVIHGPEKGKVMGCLDKAKAEIAKSGGELTVDGNVFLLKDKSGQTTAFTFVGNDTLLGTLGASGTKDALLAAAKGGSALKTSPAFTEMYGKINTKDTLWLLMNGNSPLFKQMQGMGVKPKALFGSVNLTDGLTVDMRMRLTTPDEATQLVNMAKGQISNPQVTKMFDKLDVTNDGADVKVSIALSNQKLQQLIQTMSGMMGAMMGGGMGGQ